MKCKIVMLEILIGLYQGITGTSGSGFWPQVAHFSVELPNLLIMFECQPIKKTMANCGATLKKKPSMN